MPIYKPLLCKKSFWCINKTIKSQFESVIPYHLQVPTFGEWGFNIAFNGENKREKLQVETQYLNEDNIDSMFNFGKDEMLDMNLIEEMICLNLHLLHIIMKKCRIGRGENK